MKRSKKMYAWISARIRENKRDDRAVAKRVIAWIADMELSGSTVLLSRNNKLADSFRGILLRNNWNTPPVIHNAIHERVLVLGERSYKQIGPHTQPDHVLSPEALGYLLSQKTFPKKLAEAIQFDHGETLEDYQLLGTRLIPSIVTQLQSRRYKPKEAKVSSSGGLFCDGVCCC